MNPTFEQVYPVLYKGWGEAGARADFNAGNWKNKAGAEQFTSAASNTSGGSGSTLEQVNKMITDSFTKLNTEAIAKFGEYKKNNPFALDQVLAAKTTLAAEQIDPYYNETITNYLTGINNKIQRSKEDAQMVLDELGTQSSLFTERTGASLTKAIENARSGYAESGLLSSGAALGATGETTVASGENLSDFLRGNELSQKKTTMGLSRDLTDIGLEMHCLRLCL